MIKTIFNISKKKIVKRKVKNIAIFFVEAVSDYLKNKFMLEHSRHRAFIRLVQFLPLSLVNSSLLSLLPLSIATL
jgi:hypothetical protein